MYHVFNRGNGGKDVFLDSLDYQRFLDELSRLKERGLKFLGYCLMPNHFHLLVQVADTPLSELMQAALARYSQYFNFRRGTFGNVFQARYKANLIDSNPYLLEALRYIHLNPISAKFVVDSADWRWSGHRALLGHPDQLLDQADVLGLFSNDTTKARAMYLEYLAHRREAGRLFEERKPKASHQLSQIAAPWTADLSVLKSPPFSAVIQVRSQRCWARRDFHRGFHFRT